MTIKAYCRIPAIENKSYKPKEGGCPELLYDLLGELDGAKEIHIAAYLFNNPTYFAFLHKLSSNGCKVYITTLPTAGYSDRKLKVAGYNNKISGRDMAHTIFRDIDNAPNMCLSFFPHQYIWYGALYADGGATYSFHVKAIYAKFNNQVSKCILSSGNFMFTDPYHSDSMLVFENEPVYEKYFVKLFSDLKNHSIRSNAYYTTYKSYEDEFMLAFYGKETNVEINSQEQCFFTAPFYHINGIGSNHYAANTIIDLINTANKRVWVCAQHFHDVLSFDPERTTTIVKALYSKLSQNRSIDIKILKQVKHASLADKRRAAITETLFQYIAPAQQKYNLLAHDKFILVDNSLIFSTANYTPTQFAFGLRTMKYKNPAGYKFVKKDNFSEVNGFAVVQECPQDVLNTFENHFSLLWDNGAFINIQL